MVKIWAHSGDSHFLEPEDLWQQILPAALAERMPRSERDGDDEIVHVDGKSFRRKLPKLATKKGERRARHHGAQHAPAGRARHPSPARRTSTTKGVWGEVDLPVARAVEPLIKDPELVRDRQPRRERVDRRRRSRASRPTAWCRPRRSRCSTSTTRSPRCTTPPRSVCTR